MSTRTEKDLQDFQELLKERGKDWPDESDYDALREKRNAKNLSPKETERIIERLKKHFQDVQAVQGSEDATLDMFDKPVDAPTTPANSENEPVIEAEVVSDKVEQSEPQTPTLEQDIEIMQKILETSGHEVPDDEDYHIFTLSCGRLGLPMETAIAHAKRLEAHYGAKPTAANSEQAQAKFEPESKPAQGSGGQTSTDEATKKATETAGKAGRKPQAANGELKSEKLGLYLTPTTMNTLKSLAKLHDMTVNSYIEWLIMVEHTKKLTLLEQSKELAAFARNFGNV